MSDFHGELSIEPVVGVRVFDVDSRGRLRGVTHKDVWRPGENVAECHARKPALPEHPDNRDRQLTSLLTRGAQPSGYNPPHYVDFHDPLGTAKSQRRAGAKRDELVKEWKAECARINAEWETHGLDKCDHGFWAFYEPNVEYASAARVFGIVEGYGEVVIGTKGFRASKARIVALSLPNAASEVEDYGRSLVRRNYPDVPAYPSLVKMLAEHALSKNPEPADGDFWTAKPEAKNDNFSGMTYAQIMSSLIAPPRYNLGGPIYGGTW